MNLTTPQLAFQECSEIFFLLFSTNQKNFRYSSLAVIKLFPNTWHRTMKMTVDNEEDKWWENLF